jgi:hypothetical protein
MREPSRHWRRWATTVFVAGVIVGCSHPPGAGGVQVADITVGRKLAPDGTIAADSRTNSFWTTDTFYVSVRTEGSAPSATLAARWIYQDGSVVAEDTKTLNPTGPMVVALQAAKPERWQAGDYKVEILLNGEPAGSKDIKAR